MRNEPNSVVGRGRTRRNAQNEANLPRAPKNGRGQPGPGTSCGDRLCETKPIPGCTGWDGGQRMLYKQTQSGVPGREEACRCEQTKPNLGDLGYLAKGVTGLVQTNPIWRDARCGLAPRACAGRLYKQSQFRRVATGLAVQTNPICPRRMGRRGRGWSLLRQTNPIARSGAPRRCRSWRPSRAPIFPPFHHSMACLSCETKPIPAVPGPRGSCTNKPNSGSRPYPCRARGISGSGGVGRQVYFGALQEWWA